MSHKDHDNKLTTHGSLTAEFDPIVGDMIKDVLEAIGFTLPSAPPSGYNAQKVWLRTVKAKKQKSGLFRLEIQMNGANSLGFTIRHLDYTIYLFHLNFARGGGCWISLDLQAGILAGKPKVAEAFARFVTLLMTYELAPVKIRA